MSYTALVVFFFFSSRRRHTISLCDWSSDVCSSDLDVLRAREPGDPALEAEREAAVRGHPVPERLQVALVRPGWQAPRRQGRQVVLVAVEALAAGDDLEAAEEQVEAVRVFGPPRLGMRVERPLRHRIAGHDQETG